MQERDIKTKSGLSLHEKLMVAIIRASEFMRKEATGMLRNYGLTFAQYNILRALEAAENGQRTMTDLSKIMVVSGGNITGIAKRLEANGFVIKKGHSGDERITILEITPKGKRSLKNISGAGQEHIKGFFSCYNKDEISYLTTVIKKITNQRS